MPNEYRVIRLYLPGPAYTATVSSVISTFEVLYNSFFWVPGQFVKNGSTGVAPAPERRYALEPFIAPDSGKPHDSEDIVGRIGIWNLLNDFRSWALPAEQALLIESVVPVNSIEINLSGVGETIEAAAEVLDPARRKARKERLRHEMRLNQIAEQGADMDLDLQSLELTQTKISALRDLRDEGTITPEEYTRAIRRYIGVQDEAANLIEEANIKVLGTREDPDRSDGN